VFDCVSFECQIGVRWYCHRVFHV